jgi:hypothetical protein
MLKDDETVRTIISLGQNLGLKVIAEALKLRNKLQNRGNWDANSLAVLLLRSCQRPGSHGYVGRQSPLGNT